MTKNLDALAIDTAVEAAKTVMAREGFGAVGDLEYQTCAIGGRVYHVAVGRQTEDGIMWFGRVYFPGHNPENEGHYRPTV